jgi:hypothetical protein
MHRQKIARILSLSAQMLTWADGVFESATAVSAATSSPQLRESGLQGIGRQAKSSEEKEPSGFRPLSQT